MSVIRKKKFWLILIGVVATAVAVSYTALMFKLHGFERDMRLYLIAQGVDESEILSIEAKRSMLPTYPVSVVFEHDPERSYMFKPDETEKGQFVLLDSRIPPQLVDREAQNAEYAAYLEAYGFTDAKRLGMTDSSVLAEGEKAAELLRTSRGESETDMSALNGQRVNTYKFSVDHPELREQLSLSEKDKIDAYLIKIGTLVRGGYVEVRRSSSDGQNHTQPERYTLRGEPAAP